MTFTKISGALLAIFLIVMGLKELSHAVYHPHELEEAAYKIEVPETVTGGGAAPEEVMDLGAMLRNADVSDGEAQSRKCQSCHTFDAGGANMTGPNLHGVVGHVSGTHAGFSYSSAMQEHAAAWTYEELNHFIENPRGYIPGTAMSFAGIRDDEDRVNLIAYLKSISPDAPPFPEPLPEETETEGGDDAAVEGEAAEGNMAEGEDNAETAGDSAQESGDSAAPLELGDEPTVEAGGEQPQSGEMTDQPAIQGEDADSAGDSADEAGESAEEAQ